MMNTYQVLSAGGVKTRVVADDLMEAGRIYRRDNPTEVIHEIRYKGAVSIGPGARTTIVDGNRVQIPPGYYRVRKGNTQAGDLAWWVKGTNSLYGFNPVDTIPPGHTKPLNQLGADIEAASYYCILRKRKD